jgi:hypothetical protein
MEATDNKAIDAALFIYKATPESFDTAAICRI